MDDAAPAPAAAGAHPQVERALARHRRGLAAHAAGRPAAAAQHLRAGLRLLGPQPDAAAAPVAARLLISLAHAEAEQGRVELGLTLLARAEPLAARPDRGVVLSQRGLLLLRTGRTGPALELLDRAVLLLGAHRDPLVLARVLLNRANVHMGAVRLRQARADLEHCESIAVAHGAPLLAAKAGHNRGYCELLGGNIPAALGAFDQAEAGYRAHGPGILPILEVDRARALLAAGLAAEAVTVLEAAIGAFRTQRLSQDRAEAELALARALVAAGEPEAAAARAREARRHFTARGNESWAALAQLVRARAEFPGTPHAARFAARTAALAERLRALGLSRDAVTAELLAVRARIRAGDAGAATGAALARARPRGAWFALDDRLLAHLARAELAEARGRRGEALAQLRSGLTHLHEQRAGLGSRDLQAGTAALGVELTGTGLRLALESRSVRAVFAWSERSRAQAFRLRPVRPPQDPDTAAALAELRHLDGALRAAELDGHSDPRARQRHAALRRDLRDQAWRAAGSTAPAAAPAGLAQVAAQLTAAGAGMISLLRQGDRLLALVVARETGRLVPLGSYRDTVESAYRLLGDLDARMSRRLSPRLREVVDLSARRQCEELTRAVIDPLRPLLGELAIVIVPTGPLAAIPWGLLPALRGRPVTVSPSAQLWLDARRAKGESAGAGAYTGPGPVLVAGPRLSHAHGEVAGIAPLYQNPVVLTGAEATVESALRAMDGARTVHLAAHGHHERGNVLFARIDLADGPLMAYDVQGLARAPRTVVLSACEVGRADVRLGDEHLGFTAALLYAGTHTVISSASLVADDAAPRLMTALHAALAAGRPPAEALAQASAAEPFSPFVCYGAG